MWLTFGRGNSATRLESWTPSYSSSHNFTLSPNPTQSGLLLAPIAMKWRRPVPRLRCCLEGTEPCWLSRHWSADSLGSCSLPTCRLSPTPGTLPHILTECEDLAPARQRMVSLWADFIKDKPILLPVIRKYTIDCHISQHLQFLLDCTVLPEVISLAQQHGNWVHDSLLYLTRTYCYAVHKLRLKLLGKWKFKK